MTSAAYQSTPVLLPGTVTTDFDGGVESVSQAPQILEGSGDPSGVITAPAGSFFTDVDTGDVYANSDGSDTGWAAIGGGGSTSPLTTKGDIYGFSTLDARLPVGANGKFLEADSTASLGVKWGDAPTPDLSAYSTTTEANALYVPKALPMVTPLVEEGGTQNCSADQFTAITPDGGPIAALTVNLNASANGKITRGCFCGTITTVSWTSSVGSIKGTPLATAVDGDAFAYIYDANSTSFRPLV